MICQKHPFWQQLNLTAFTWLDKSTILFVIRVDIQQQQTTQIDFNYASINNIRSIVQFRKPDVVITKIYCTNKFDTNCNSIVGIYAPRPEFRLFVVECNRDNFEYIFRSKTHKFADGTSSIIFYAILVFELFSILVEILSFYHILNNQPPPSIERLDFRYLFMYNSNTIY